MNKSSKLIIVEGAKNVGKSYLIGKSGLPSYKFPFASYFNEFLKNNTDNVGSNDKTTYHFTTSYDITTLSLAKQGLIKEGMGDHDGQALLMDRGFLSNIVLGVSQGRITKDEGFSYIDFLYKEGYIDTNLRIVYVYRDNMEARNVPQDQWEYLDAYKLHELYLEYMVYLREEYNFTCEMFKNNLDEDSLHRFKLACAGSVKLEIA